MQNLDERTWNPVKLDSMFSFERGKEKNMASLIQGHIPLVSARKVNNGIKGFVDNPVKVIKGGNVISLNNDGDGGAGLAYYQPIDFALDTHVTALHPKKEISSDALLCMTASISKQHTVFGHGRSISLLRAHRIQNMLPVTNSGEPDYEYMTEYIQQKREAMLSKYRAYVEERIAELGASVEIPALDEKEWHKFAAFGPNGLFEISTTNSSIDGIRLIDGVDKTVPYVTRTDTNNGIARFVSSSNLSYGSDCGGCITVGLDTQTVFWQPHKFVTGQNIQVITGKELNFYLVQFLIPLFKNQMRAKFNWGGNGATLGRMKKLELLLPITDSGEPDYEYMEQYTKNMMLRKYLQYMAFLDRSDYAW